MISLVWRATYANGDGTNVLRDSKFKYEFIELLKIACQRNEWVSKCIGFDNESKRDWSVGTETVIKILLKPSRAIKLSYNTLSVGCVMPTDIIVER